MGNRGQSIGIFVALAALGAMAMATLRRDPQTPQPKDRPKQQKPEAKSRLDQYVDQVAGLYQATFDDLSLIGDNRFGMSRIEHSMIEKHAVHVNAKFPEYGLSYGLRILGNMGKPLDPTTMETRYSRMPYPHFQIGTANPQADRVNVKAFLNKSTERIIKGQEPLPALRIGQAHYVVRAARLSSKECLSCHTQSKVGDPIAIMIFSVGVPASRE